MPAFKSNPKFMEFAQTIPGRIALFAVCKLYALIIAGYCLIPFAYLRFYKWWAVYKEFYFIGHIVILPMLFVWRPLVLKGLDMFFPIEKTPAKVASIDDKTALNDRKVNQHDKTN